MDIFFPLVTLLIAPIEKKKTPWECGDKPTSAFFKDQTSAYMSCLINRAALTLLFNSSQSCHHVLLIWHSQVIFWVVSATITAVPVQYITMKSRKIPCFIDQLPASPMMLYTPGETVGGPLAGV